MIPLLKSATIRQKGLWQIKETQPWWSIYVTEAHWKGAASKLWTKNDVFWHSWIVFSIWHSFVGLTFHGPCSQKRQSNLAKQHVLPIHVKSLVLSKTSCIRDVPADHKAISISCFLFNDIRFFCQSILPHHFFRDSFQEPINIDMALQVCFFNPAVGLGTKWNSISTGLQHGSFKFLTIGNWI